MSQSRGLKIFLKGEESPWLPSSVSETKVPETAEGPRTPSSGAQTPPRNAWLVDSDKKVFLFDGSDIFAKSVWIRF